MQQPTPQRTAPAERKSLPEYLSILQGGNCRETGASCKRGGSQVKTITIRLPDVEAAMLIALQKRNKNFRSLDEFMRDQVRHEYSNTFSANLD
jgi:hypothetical protein